MNKNKVKIFSEQLRPFFWEIDLSKIDFEENKQYIIERILELGDSDAVQWLFSNVSLLDIKNTLEKRRRISQKSKNLWSIFLEDYQDERIHIRQKDKKQFSTSLPSRFYCPLLPCWRDSLCIHLGHRISDDLDFFSKQDLAHFSIQNSLQKSGYLMVESKIKGHIPQCIWH